jgi:glycosidase
VFEGPPIARADGRVYDVGMSESLARIVHEIYPAEGDEVIDRLTALLSEYQDRMTPPGTLSAGEKSLTESDSIMITYGDSFRGAEGTPLSWLLRFLDDEAEGVVSGVHILPFSPYSSDDGFSVIDYHQVNPELGSWNEIRAIAGEFTLMVDLVLNHCSISSRWFQGFLSDETPYSSYFITAEENTDVSAVARPRAHPLLTRFDTPSGPKWVWTTFSTDQADLNFANPDVLLEMLGVLFSYVERGARIIRLDAIAYLWKELGTPCLHHPKTHAIVRLVRHLVDLIAPWVVIITETNVPHRENISYFGSGDEAHMVYNFSLPPLTLDAFLREDTAHLQRWAASLNLDIPNATYFNFLASHDGIGLLPTNGILSDAERESMIAAVCERGGLVSYKATGTGDIPYEMNISYLDAIAPSALPDSQRARIFLASQSIMLCLAGVPGIYYHSLIGSGNWKKGVEKTGHNRAINREKLEFESLSDALNQEDSLRHLVFEGFKGLLRARAGSPAFHPASSQRVVSTPDKILAVLRSAPEKGEQVLCLVNVSSDVATTAFSLSDLGAGEEKGFRDLLSGDYVFPSYDSRDRISLELEPYEILWLRL